PPDDLTRRNPDFNFYPPRVSVGCAELPAMQPYRPVRNRQAQTRAPGLPVASVVEPIKGLKDLFQRFLGNARAGIEHANHQLIAMGRPLPLQSHFHRRTFSTITRRV